MLYLLINQLGWLAFIALLIVVVVLYAKINQQVGQLRRDMAKLQADLERYKNSVSAAAESPTSAVVITESIDDSPLEPVENLPLASNPPKLPKQTELPKLSAKLQKPTSVIEPDERSLPIVTSLLHSIKNWFFGGNLVVRVGVLVLLVGVVLLLRLLSDYIEIPLTVKLLGIGIIGLALAALGLKLAKNRFAYGITLQGAGLAIAYLTTFFAYSAYQVLASAPSFMGLGILSAITIALAVRQNAFPLALLALSGGFFAPILTSSDIGNLVTLFSYYLLLLSLIHI